jgi:hypothetical protein
MLTLAACGQPTPPAKTSFVWPNGLHTIGDGYPKPGDSCRRLGESELTADYLDDSAVLVGCPGGAGDVAAKAILDGQHARLVGNASGVAILSVPLGDANVGMPSASGKTE